MERDDDRWTRRTVEWLPRDCTRPRGRPPARWSETGTLKRSSRIDNGLLHDFLDKRVDESGIRTHAPEGTGAFNQRLRPLGHLAAIHRLTRSGHSVSDIARLLDLHRMIVYRCVKRDFLDDRTVSDTEWDEFRWQTL
ncbi:unnamed protein product [Nippostrongylus brasiliensis]|uniref:HTH_7 domain-containing protein n=1 Tax=Nippostrongylus brasiliensis TaxID=27835 RepID=A0A0N4XWR5_NIPBR|nr:unnamed protein product [Nippostrongylus brasiliensis]